MSVKLSQTFSHSSSHHSLIMDVTINNQYTKNVEPKHEAKELQKLGNPKTQSLQTTNI